LAPTSPRREPDAEAMGRAVAASGSPTQAARRGPGQDHRRLRRRRTQAPPPLRAASAAPPRPIPLSIAIASTRPPYADDVSFRRINVTCPCRGREAAPASRPKRPQGSGRSPRFGFWPAAADAAMRGFVARAQGVRPARRPHAPSGEGGRFRARGRRRLPTPGRSAASPCRRASDRGRPSERGSFARIFCSLNPQRRVGPFNPRRPPRPRRVAPPVAG